LGRDGEYRYRPADAIKEPEVFDSVIPGQPAGLNPESRDSRGAHRRHAPSPGLAFRRATDERNSAREEMTGSCAASSTPPLIRSITNASGKPSLRARAKQSMALRVEDWIASSLSLLAMTPEFKHSYRPRGAMRPRFCQALPPSCKQRVWGETREAQIIQS
jgi:hypothetical protein